MNDNRADIRVGVVGIGLMGHGIASNIQKHGWPLGFLDHPGNQPVDTLVGNGAQRFATGRELAAHCDVVIVCVTGSPQVEDVLFRDDGVLKGLKPGGVVIDCSTAIPSSTEQIADAVATAGGRFLDAPMTRTPKEAAEGRLNLIVGGDRELFEKHKPLLESFAENITYAGPVGAGHKLKLLHNFVSVGFSTVLAEAAACAQLGGIEPETLVEVLAKVAVLALSCSACSRTFSNETVPAFASALPMHTRTWAITWPWRAPCRPTRTQPTASLQCSRTRETRGMPRLRFLN